MSAGFGKVKTLGGTMPVKKRMLPQRDKSNSSVFEQQSAEDGEQPAPSSMVVHTQLEGTFGYGGVTFREGGAGAAVGSGLRANPTASAAS